MSYDRGHSDSLIREDIPCSYTHWNLYERTIILMRDINDMQWKWFENITFFGVEIVMSCQTVQISKIWHAIDYPQNRRSYFEKELDCAELLKHFQISFYLQWKNNVFCLVNDIYFSVIFMHSNTPISRFSFCCRTQHKIHGVVHQGESEIQ